jgi:transposase InsO family protein
MFINEQRSAFPVEKMCQILKVSRSGFYAWIKKPESKRRKENAVLLKTIINIREKQTKKQVYGAPRMTMELNSIGLSCGKNRIARIMSTNKIQAKTKKKFKQTTDSQHKHPIAPNLLSGDFKVNMPNKIYVTDITYIWTAEGWLYLAIVLDLFSRIIVGWSMRDRMTRDLVMEALNKAIESRRPTKGLIVHSDKGSQYASHDYRKLLSKYKFIQSMSGKGNCYDNAVMESFFHTLKTEWVFFERYQTRAQAKTSVFDYIETFYNRERRHSTLGYMSPWNYEKKHPRAA